MSNSYFKFKQFTIEQDGCAMKVGTDGCLLGAWFDTTNSKRILDIGAGTGLISIMAAQRSNAQITGIEIDSTAAGKAIENVNNSPWSNRVTIVNADLNIYTPSEPFDTIVSNPPFFENSLKCDDKQRSLARHSDTLSPEQFFAKANELLTSDGKISIIIPSDNATRWEAEAIIKGFSLQRATAVRTTPKKAAKRTLIEFGRTTCTPIKSELILEDQPGIYSKEATGLLKDFYLKL